MSSVYTVLYEWVLSHCIRCTVLDLFVFICVYFVFLFHTAYRAYMYDVLL